MKKWDLYATVVGGKYLGQVEAESEAEAIEKANDLDSIWISICHHCSSECEDAQVETISAQEIL